MQLKFLFVPLMSFMLYACGNNGSEKQTTQSVEFAAPPNDAAGYDNEKDKEDRQIPPPLSPKQEPPPVPKA